MSIPADTPDEVKNLPSSTQRASLIHLTFGPWVVTQSNASLFEVAFFPVQYTGLGQQSAAGADTRDKASFVRPLAERLQKR